jgi:hypothetical protein
MTWLNACGSVASILGLLLAAFVLWRELRIEKQVRELKTEEEGWHNDE